MQQMQFCI